MWLSTIGSVRLTGSRVRVQAKEWKYTFWCFVLVESMEIVSRFAFTRAWAARLLYLGFCFAACLDLAAQDSAANKRGNASYDRAADSHSFTVFMREGGWCWYQDPRAILHNGQVIIGAVQGNGSGDARIGVYDLVHDKPLGSFVAHDNFDRDDHNSPVFYPRPDGSVLTMYARHGREKTHYYRISDPSDYLRWGDERRIEYDGFLVAPRDRVTYMNLFPLSAERKLYCFFRGLEFNPCVVSSPDHGESWEDAKHFIRSEVEGRHRPYVRYAGNGVDRVHITFTDAHPRNYGNNIYYALFKGGKFYKADGTLIKDLDRGGPLRPSEADLVFRGSEEAVTGKHGASAPRSAWTSSIAFDDGGHPHLGYSYYLSNDDHRYRIASWDGRQWIDREVAFAGSCLYEAESSYTGLIALDPVDPSFVVISTDVHPTSGKGVGETHEIYRAKIDLRDDRNSIRWKAVTKKSPCRNIRPIILREGPQRVVLWNRGQFNTYTNYQLDTVGFVEEAP